MISVLNKRSVEKNGRMRDCGSHPATRSAHFEEGEARGEFHMACLMRRAHSCLPWCGEYFEVLRLGAFVIAGNGTRGC